MKQAERRGTPEQTRVQEMDRDGGFAFLVWKSPDSEFPYHRVLWRAGATGMEYSRAFVLPDQLLWSFALDAARQLLAAAYTGGMLAARWDRWPSNLVRVSDTAHVGHDKVGALRQAVLTDWPADRPWLVAPDTRIIACREPGPTGWWKVLVMSSCLNRISVRAVVKRPPNGGDRIRTLGNWSIHPVLMDADTVIHRIHLAAILSATEIR